jgi:PAS domain S-box-containing protein
MESSLYARDDVGQPICDNAGNPILECICGNVINGRFDPSKPFITAQGSFWTNSTTELLDIINDADCQGQMRNRCNGTGYESVALITLRVDENRLGILQLNDTSKGQFSPETIAMWERLAGYLAVALARAQVEELLLEAYETLQIQSEKLEIKSEELQKTNEALSESEEKYRNIIETANEGIFLMNAEFKITYVNKRTVELIGYSQEETIGRPAMDFICEESKHIAEKSLEKRHRAINESYESKLMCKDGSSFWASINAKPLFNKDGDFTGSLSMFTDITKRKEAEAKLKETLDNLENLVKERTDELEEANKSLKESEKGLAEAQKMAHLGNWDWNLISGEMYWSEEMYRIFGRTPHKFSSYSEVLSYTHPDDRKYVDNAVKRALKEESFAIDHRLVLASGEERTVHAQGKVVFDEKNTPVRMRGTVQDITELKKSEEKIRSSICI